MDRRTVLFLVFSFCMVLLSFALKPQAPPPKQAHKQVANKQAEKAGGKTAEKSKSRPMPAAKQPAEKPNKPTPAFQPPPPQEPERYVALGSASDKDPCRMLAMFTNKGAALVRIELNSPHYRDIDHRNGYLGHLVINPLAAGNVCRVQVVGSGTPAADAGIEPGDVIESFNGKDVADHDSLDALLAKTKPKQKVEIGIVRGGKHLKKQATLTRIPLEVIKPESNDPPSMLLTLDSVDELKLTTQWARDAAIYRLYSELKLGEQEIADLDLTDIRLKKEDGEIRMPGETPQEKQWVSLSGDERKVEVRKALAAWLDKRGSKAGPLFCQLPFGDTKEKLTVQNVHGITKRARLGEDWKNQPSPFFELEGVNLRTANWKVVSAGEKNVAQFRYTLPDNGLEITKTYRLVEVPAESIKDENYQAYHLVFEIEIHNPKKSAQAHKVAYRLDGPNGLPTEGAWYSSRVTRDGGSGLRDFVVSFSGQTPGMVGAVNLDNEKFAPVRPDSPDKLLTFVGVDAQYFSAVLMPQREENPSNIWFDNVVPIRVGKVNPKHTNLTNTSCRLISALKELKPGETLTHKFHLFAGPKKTTVLAPYKLDELIYFGWPIYSWPAQILTHILHFFFALTQNYGLAIILLTVFVRGCMFPLSLKQVAGAQKMQMLQPELKKLQEKHKGNAEARTKAQQELFRKHNYNPLAGCMPIFIQMPIFIGLYRSLMVAIELRDAPLFTNSIQWCSNLAGPDMLWNWSSFLRGIGANFVVEGAGIFPALGPFFNLLPILTIILFIVQQKVLMPPATDPQAAATQKMMKYMMIFMGFMFFKVASGLCIYFVASSLWGLAERKFLPKTAPVAAGNSETRAQAKARERAEAVAAAKNKKK